MFKCYDRPFLQMLKFSSRYGLYKNVTFAAILLHVTRIQKSEEEKKVISIDNEEKPLFVLHMTVKLIGIVIQFRVLFT